MLLEEEKFDVRVLTTPSTTPHGEEFAAAISRVFGVELGMAEQIVRQAPVFVKRAVPLAVAEHLRTTLERLGARVAVQRESSSSLTALLAEAPMPSLPAARFARPSVWPPGLPPDSPHAPGGTPYPPIARPLPSEWLHPSPPPRASSRPPQGTLHPTAPPTVRGWTPLPPPPPRSTVGAGSILLGTAAAIAILFALGTHWLRGLGDAELLGNTPNQETACTRNYGLSGPGLDADKRAKLTIVVAWRAGCLSEDYAGFLKGLADAHPGDLAVLGAGLAVTEPRNSLAPHSMRAVPLPPEQWPPRDCEPGFELLPTSTGYVSDSLSAPATYLYDGDGSLVAAWRGGMSAQQRERLTAWLDRRGWW